MKRFVILTLVFCLTGCGVVSDLFNSTKDDLSNLTALVSGDISFLKSNINELTDSATNSSVSCADFVDNIDINVYQTSDDGEMFLRDVVADILTSSDTNDVCNYKFDIDQLDSGLTTIETIMTNQSKGKKIIQRISDSLEDNKTNVISTITKETTEIADRLIPIILEKYVNQNEKEKIDKFDDAQLKIYVDIVKDTIKETIKTLKNNYAFNTYDVLDLKPISEEFFDLDNERVNLEKYKNSRFTKNDFENIKKACDNDKAGNNYMDMIDLKYTIKNHGKDKEYVQDIIADVLGEDMIVRNPAAVELVREAYLKDNRVSFDAIAKAIMLAMDYTKALADGAIKTEVMPASFDDVVNLIQNEITNDSGSINSIFKDYEDTSKTYREKFRNEHFIAGDKNNGLLSIKGMKAIFNEDHPWRNKTTIQSNETMNVLELWTILMMAMEKEYIHDEYFDMSKFFYELKIVDMDKPFVVDMFIDKENNTKELIIVIVDTKNIINKVKTTVTLTNSTSSKTQEIELSNPSVYGFDKEFKVNLNTIEINNFIIKSGDLTVSLIGNNQSIILEHTQELFNFTDIFHKTHDYDDYYDGFEDNHDNQIEHDIVNTSYIETIIVKNHFEDYGNDYSVTPITDLSIVGTDLASQIPSSWVFEEGESIHLFLDDVLVKPQIKNDYLDRLNLEFKYKIIEVIKPINENNPVVGMDSIKSYYDANDTKQWSTHRYDNETLVNASRVIAEGKIDADTMDIELPMLEPNVKKQSENYFLHYKLCVKHIVRQKDSGKKINKNKYQCFPFFIQPVNYANVP